jgi:hypothetical protein
MTVAEHDPARQWIVVGDIRHMTVDLEDGAEFYEWAAQAWPRSRFSVELDPWQLSPGERPG